MKRPIIGVLSLYDTEKENCWMLPGYMNGIEEAGGIPVILPLTVDKEVILSITRTFDGFLFTGGHDVNPNIYGENAESFCGELCNERDLMEEILFKEAVRLDKPILGICRGLQLINALSGGTLYQDIPNQTQSKIVHKQAGPYDKPIHMVRIKKDTLLYKIMKQEVILVNSYHHQGIKKLSQSLLSNAESEDGLIEAINMPGKKFVLAVQWHPEMIYKAVEINLRLFIEFVKSCYNNDCHIKIN